MPCPKNYNKMISDATASSATAQREKIITRFFCLLFCSKISLSPFVLRESPDKFETSSLAALLTLAEFGAPAFGET
jgi:hypothetical protein